jgi:hypothetical protein
MDDFFLDLVAKVIQVNLRGVHQLSVLVKACLLVSLSLDLLKFFLS